jgi:hypothetical protein
VHHVGRDHVGEQFVALPDAEIETELGCSLATLESEADADPYELRRGGEA